MSLFRCQAGSQLFIVNVCKRFLHFDKSLFVSTHGNHLLNISRIFPEKSTDSNMIYVRKMAGHAKWQNIQHIKAAKDKEKNILCSKYSYLVSVAVKENGPDPKLNSKLAKLLDEAKRKSVPFSTLESAMKRGSNKKVKDGMIEILGPGGCFIIIQYETDNISTMRHEIKGICKKHSANVLPGEGRWRAVYDQKGIIKVVGLLDGQPLDAETALDAAIEAGAEEVHPQKDEEDKVFFEFHCAPEDLHLVKKELEKKYDVEEAYIGFLPITNMELSQSDRSANHNLLNELNELNDVVRIFENLQ